MNRTKTISTILAGVSAVALFAAIAPAHAGGTELKDDTSPSSIVTSTEMDVLKRDYLWIDNYSVDGSVTNDVSIGGGLEVENRYGINVFNNSVIHGDLINDATVTANVASTSVLGPNSETGITAVGIYVDDGAQVHGEVVNHGYVAAKAIGVNGLDRDAAFAFGISVLGDDSPHLDNGPDDDGGVAASTLSPIAKVHAYASATGSDNAVAIAGGLGEITIGQYAHGVIDNNGIVGVKGFAHSMGDEDDDSSGGATAIALGYGAGQLMVDLGGSATADLVNATDGDVDVYLSASASDYGTSVGVAAGVGLVQGVLSGNDSEGHIVNDGSVTVTALGYGHSFEEDPEDDEDPLIGAGAGAAVGAGSIQLVLGAHDSLATADNYGEVGVRARGDGSSDDGLGLGVAVGLGGLQLAGAIGDADAVLQNYGTVGVEVDAYASGELAIAVGAGIGEAQVAISLEGEATAYINNAGSIGVDAYAESSGVAVGLGLGALQAAVSDDEANATFDNTGTITVGVLSKGQSFGPLPSAIGVGAAQIALSYDDDANAKFTNSKSIVLNVDARSSDDSASANAMGLGGTLQVAGSYWDAAIAELTNAVGSVIDVNGSATASAETDADANAYVIGAGQIALSADDDAVANVVNNGDITAYASSRAVRALDPSPSEDEDYLDADADADAAGLDQAMLSGGAKAIANVKNFDLIQGWADAYASGTGTTASAVAGAQGINQYGFAELAELSVINSGDINGTAHATAYGTTAKAEAVADGLVQSGLSISTTAKLHNSGDVTAEAIAVSDDEAVASATGHRVETPAEAFNALAGFSQLAAPDGALAGTVLDVGRQGVLEYLIAPYASVGPLSQYITQLPIGTGIEWLRRSEALGLIGTEGGVPTGGEPDAVGLTLDVNNGEDSVISGYAKATGGHSASARAEGAWYQATGFLAPASIDGKIVNSGLISGYALAEVTGMAEAGAEDWVSETAHAFGVMQISTGTIETELTNSGIIRADAFAEHAQATAVGIASYVFQSPNHVIGAVEEPPVATVNNDGGVLWASVRTDLLDKTDTRGNAINTRGLDIDPIFDQPPEEPLIVAAPNKVVINLMGGDADGAGKAFAKKYVSTEIESAFADQAGWGYVYGNIQINEAKVWTVSDEEIDLSDEINVTEGVTLLDGVINAQDPVEDRDDEWEPDLVGNLNINNGGTLAFVQPHSPDDGQSGGYVENFTINSTGTLAYELTAENTEGEDYAQLYADNADITDGNLKVVYRAGHYDDLTIYQDIVDANVLTGKFATPTDNSLLLKTTAVYEYGDDTNEAQNVDLVVERTAFNDVPGQTHNQNAVGGAIEKVYGDIDPESNFGKLVTSMFTVGNEDDYADFLDQLSGAEYAQQLQSVLWSTRTLNRVVTDRMECTDGSSGGTQTASAKVGDNTVMPTADAPMASTGCFEPGQASVWMSGYGQWTALDGDDEAPGLDETQYGILFGADYSFDESWFAGIAGGYFNSNGDFEDWGGRSGGSSEYDGLQVAAYGGYDNSTYYLRGVLAYGNYDGSVDRNIDTTELVQGLGTTGNLSGDPSSDVFSFYGETGYRFAITDAGNITPFAGLSLASATLEGFTEDDNDGTGAALDVEDSDASSVASVLGLRLDADMAMSSGVFTPSVSVAWMHEFGDTEQTVDASFADAPGSDFSVIGSEVARDSVLVDAGANFSMDDTFDFGLFYNGQFNENYSANAVTARLGYRF